MVVPYAQEEDREAVAGEPHGPVAQEQVIEPMRSAYREEYQGVLGTSPLTESLPSPEGHADQSVGTLREGAQKQYYDLFALTRLSPKESAEFQEYLKVPYESLTPERQGNFDILRAKAAGLDQIEIDEMVTARQRLHEAIARGEPRSPTLDHAEQTYLRLWDKAKVQWEKLSQSA
ncbi:hypothetical protein A2635_04330 [Candidatus Peribacteria bacterium RIFCSPHIGHO2_01_FULL_51_9]|nr:MAG: hypothetical protein A2635_04330 [Candidatus Peribacteria bacterium RIFCSPHIGHO2_01_FULL_51_9]